MVEKAGLKLIVIEQPYGGPPIFVGLQLAVPHCSKLLGLLQLTIAVLDPDGVMRSAMASMKGMNARVLCI
jgi:hypothetical protein